MSDKGTHSYSNRHRMHEVSDTPRTDERVIQFGDGPAKYVYAAFADQLERENAELRKDKERLNWLLDENSCTHIERGRYDLDGDWLVKTLHNRSDIDREMDEWRQQICHEHGHPSI